MEKSNTKYGMLSAV